MDLCAAYTPSPSPVSLSTQDGSRTNKVPVDAGPGAASSCYAFNNQHARQVSRSQSRSFPLNIDSSEPTVVPPVLLDLCTVAILHRFSSPSWWEHLAKHVSADISVDDAFDRVVRLEVRLYAQGFVGAESVLSCRPGKLSCSHHLDLVCFRTVPKYRSLKVLGASL